MKNKKPKKSKLCEECGDVKPLPFHKDPRDPPMEEDECLCKDCCISALYDVIDQKETSLHEYRTDLAKLLAKDKLSKKKR